MRIAIDIDRTINNSYIHDILNGIRFMREKGNYKGMWLHHYYPKDIFDMNENEYNEFMDIYFPQIVRFCPLKDYACEVITKLHKQHDIVIMTARDEHYSKRRYRGEEMKKDTLRWLSRKKIPYDTIKFSAFNKYKACKELGCDILIDDSPTHIIECADNGLPVIIMGEVYNAKLKGYPNTYYATSWKEIPFILFTMGIEK